ncbi:unnamed protein product [Chrysodeixis includens]|uniref:Mediator of DNA damage checkpoint protein 1 n=1 Tax=Chrysodeixis includens TaxID=689277 RepID=A0A9P0C403_CHRIL|nr:unnamed protein product [Chrysodeixis includens]
MECTQRLECTQELYDTQTQRVCPEQVGFLGICGEKHPVLRGVNKIGRDPQTCSIVLNLNSVSRQHAVINVLNGKEYMLMDLDSANKTKVQNKRLQPFVPHPLKNGDTVQFGDIFGIFRLLVEDDELPMTQALDLPLTQVLDIPETPLPSKAVSKIHRAQTTVIPESPDVSGDDSFISISNQTSERTRLSSGQFIKPFGKTISIKPVGSPQSPITSLSKRSTSLSFIDNPNTSLNESLVSRKSDKNVPNIFDMDTQPPDANETNDSIYTADTQAPPQPFSPSIYSLNTQLPTADNLPEIRKIDNQHDMQLDLFAANKENETHISNAETQPFGLEKNESMEQKKNEKENHQKDKVDGSVKAEDVSGKSANTSEEELLFDDIDGDVFEDDLHSQNILLDEVPLVEVVEKVDDKAKVDKTPSKRTNRTISGSSTDCEDIFMMPTQKVAELPQDDSKQNVNKVDLTNEAKPPKSTNGVQSDCSTDCEDIDMVPTQKIPERKVDVDDDVTDCEDNEVSENKPVVTADHTKFDDMPTQILDEYHADKPVNDNADIEDQPTQIVEEIVPQETEESKTSLSKIQSFKVPVESPKRVKNKDGQKPSPINTTVTSKPGTSTSKEDNYYQATQDIYDDLCSQREMSPDILQINQDDKLVTIDLVASPAKKHEDALNKLQKSLTRTSDVKGATQVASLKKVPSDSSDVESTPKKLRPFLFTDSDLPSSQEITTSMMTKHVSAVVDLSSESEPENSEDQATPIVHRKKKTKPAPKLDLSKKFEIEMLPERIMTRQRKPTDKLGSSTDKNISSRILKSSYLLDQEDQVDQEIISENIKRLKSFEKAKSLQDSKNDISPKEEVKETRSGKRGRKSKEESSKEKIKVKIEKPKKKETKAKSRSPQKSAEKNSKQANESSVIPETRSRRTRAKKNETETKENTSKNSISPDNNEKETEKKTRGRKKERSTSPEITVRRSKRQITKEKIAEELRDQAATNSKLKPILKHVRQESMEYNMSSSGDTVKGLKRTLVEDSEVPSPKRTRPYTDSSNDTSSGIKNSSLRATPARLNKTHNVLLTAFPSDEVKQKLEKLGAVIVTDVMQCSVVLTMHIKRTFKLLCALGLGKPIVGPGWVQACNDTNIIVDPWLYLVKDEAAEKRFGFSLRQSLTGKRDFLRGYNVSSTPSVLPDATEMELIVKCSGGSWQEGGARWVCVSCSKDKALWPALRRRGATIVSSEFILCGVLKQKLDINSYVFT